MEKINSYALRLLGRREFSIFELEERLNKKFIDQKEEILKVLEKFKRKDWVSDSRFCEVFIKDQIIKKQGPRKIEMKLYKKGVSSELIKKALEEFYPEIEQVIILKYLAEKKKNEIIRRKSKISEYELNGKTKQFLIGRGFGYEVLEIL